jgi:hypothetical protein
MSSAQLKEAEAGAKAITNRAANTPEGKADNALRGGKKRGLPPIPTGLGGHRGK